MKIVQFFGFSIFFLLYLLINKSKADIQELEQDFSDFVDLIPMSDIKWKVGIFQMFDWDFNKQLKDLLQYIKGDQFMMNFLKILDDEDVLAVTKTLQEADLDFVGKILSIIKKLPETKQKSRTKRNVKDFLDEVIKILPMDKFRSLVEEKRVTSKSFAKLYNAMTTDEMKKRYENISKIPELLEILSEFKKRGLDLEEFIKDLDFSFLPFNFL